MDIRSFFKSPPKPAANSSTPPTNGKSPDLTSPKKEEEVAKNGEKHNSNTPQSPGKSPAKAKRKVHDLNVNFTNALDALAIKDAPNLGSGDFEAKFEEIAQFLLNQCIFHINEIPHRFIEVEFYYYGYNHIDTFAHCGEQQLTRGEWYFHKTGNRYREGNYKGIDITFGDGVAYGGILIRSVQMLEAPFTFKCGPSLTVDHILDLTKQPDIPTFVKTFGVKAIKEEGEGHKALYVTKASDLKVLPIVKSIRVGLSMKRYEPEREFYFGKTYRYLTQPSKVTKGKHYMVVGMHQQKTSRADIATITAVAPKTVAKYVEAFDAGTKKDFRKYIGLQDLAVDEECSLIGACSIIPPPPPKPSKSKKVETEKEIEDKETEKQEQEEKMEKQEKKEMETEEKRGTKRKAGDSQETEEDADAIELLEKEEKKKKAKVEDEDDQEAVELLEKEEKKKKAKVEDEDDQEAVELLEKEEKKKAKIREDNVDDQEAIELLEKEEKKSNKGEKKEAEEPKENGDKSENGEKTKTKGGNDTEEDEEALQMLEKVEKKGKGGEKKVKKGKSKEDTEEDEAAIQMEKEKKGKESGKKKGGKSEEDTEEDEDALRMEKEKGKESEEKKGRGGGKKRKE